MKADGGFRHGVFYLASALIFIAGGAASAFLYTTAEENPVASAFHEFEQSRRYRHDLELYGGKANLLADDFLGWFGGLWQGSRLAVTIAVITAVESALLLASGLKLRTSNQDWERKER